MLAISVILKVIAQSKQSPIGRKFAQSGHPALILRFLGIAEAYTSYDADEDFVFLPETTMPMKKALGGKMPLSSFFVSLCLWKKRYQICSRWHKNRPYLDFWNGFDPS
jgi:hypothetical protein